jgi:hypothetical protein
MFKIYIDTKHINIQLYSKHVLSNNETFAMYKNVLKYDRNIKKNVIFITSLPTFTGS